MQHFRSDQPASYLMPMPLFSDNALVDTKPVTFERVANTRTNNTYNPASTQCGRRFASVNNSYPSFPATTSTPTHNIYSRQLHSPLNPISRNARPSRPSPSPAFDSSAPAASSSSTKPHSPTPSTMQSQPTSAGATLYAGQFFGLFQGYEQTPMAVAGTLSALQKLSAARAAGLSIPSTNNMSAAAAFQLSLRPFQNAGVFPTDGEMASLFNLPESDQRACGFDKNQDFAITDNESARNMIVPPLLALRDIDCARKYLEIGNRYHQGTRYCFDVLIVTVAPKQLLVHDLPPPLGSHSTHSVLLFRQFMPDDSGRFTESWRPSTTSHGVPDTRPDPLSSMPATAAAGPSTLAPPTMPPSAQPAQATQTTHNWRPGNGVDPLAGVTDPNTVEGDFILRVAMRNTNKEIHRKLADLGSEAKYNSITKRISNALKAQARAELQPGEQFDPKYEALREEFDTQRNASLGRQPAQRGRGNGGVGKGKRRKTGSKTFVAGDESDMEEDLEDDEEGGAGGGYSLRSSNRAPRANINGQAQYEVDEDDLEDGLGGHDDGDDSDGSVYDGT